MRTEPLEPFAYLHFARTEMLGAEHELCMSGVPAVDPLTLGEDGPGETVPATSSDARSGSPFTPSAGGDPLGEWRRLIAARSGVPEDHSIPTLGTSGGAFVALAALIEQPGARGPVAIERPAYGIFESGARFLGLPVVHVDRPRGQEYALDLDRVASALAAGARIYCLTNLQNPVGLALARAEIEALRDLARRHDAWILLDEVYRDYVPGPIGTDYAPGERIVCTSSLTKVYGLGGLRAGWILGPPEVIAAADHVMEILHGVYPEPSATLFIRGLRHADDLRKRSLRLAQRARPVIDAWIASHDQLSWVPPAAGISGLVHVDGLQDSMDVARRLRSELDVQVVPGAFFGVDDAIRISFGLPPARLQRALEVLSLGLGALLR